jgi:Reverse transcriptase (RNA-dependent DNA polymerase)
VKEGLTMSSKRRIKCGIAQGSVLGPIMFIIFINTIFRLKLKGKIQLFADDEVLLYGEKSFEELQRNIASDLEVLHKWLMKYRLTMNVEKTHFIIFQMKNSNLNGIFDEVNFGNQKITRVSSYKYLGLWIDDRLNYFTHITKVKSKISPMIGVFHRINKFITPEVLKNLYFSYVHSHMAYLISIWGAATANKM